ncbi:MAG: type I restriction enzyme endonuclease domain-containing protein [Thiobacillaceae bacterium]
MTNTTQAARTSRPFFDELMTFAQGLNDEEKRAMREGMDDEEELALFDILTKPEPKLTKAEEVQVKKAAQELLKTEDAQA